MVKSRSQYICQQCGYSQVSWAGKCPNCGEWNSLIETIVDSSTSSRKGSRQVGVIGKPVSLSSVSIKRTSRISTKILELDRVLGGGLVDGQVILIAGEPGIGKSTLLLQVASNLSKNGDVLYVSGEESASQIAIRAQRLGISEASPSGRKNKSIQLLENNDVDSIIETTHTFKGGTLQGVIIDSIQTMATSDLSGMASSVGQVRECAARLVQFAKKTGTPIFIVGHVTKEGTIAGPSVLMHIVDTVLWFEGDKSLTIRMLRAVKNRFGPTDEVGVFLMQEKGLISATSPEKIFITDEVKKMPGTAVTSILEGTRPILIEVQSLVVPSKLPFPKRVAQGIDSKRFELLLAVLIRRAELPLYEYDCYVNLAGGISIRNDPSADLAICLSIASAFLDKALPRGTISLGEVGLLGDIREVTAQEKRIKEARRLGYKHTITNRQISYLSQAIKKYIK